MDSQALRIALRNLTVLLAALLLAVGASACSVTGDDENGSGDETSASTDMSTDETDTGETDTDETDTDATDTDETDTDSGGSEEDEVNARAAVDALLLGVGDADADVICGLLSEDYANELTGETELGIAKCVENLEMADLSDVQSQLEGIEVDETEVDAGGDTATVTLTNGEEVDLMKDPEDESRYVITGGLE